MLKVVVLSSMLLAALAVPLSDHTSFEMWKITHGKAYNSDEEAARFAIWSDNLQKVNAHNERYQNVEETFFLKMNSLADLTPEEYKVRLGLRASASPSNQALGTYTATAAPPASWDWRTHTPNIVNPVKDQGQCGSCWAFSAVATMEGAWNLKNKALVSLSEQELVDCVKGGADTCSVGGEMYDGIAYAAQSGGMENEKEYPYQATSGHACRFKKSESVAQFKGYTNVTSGDEAGLTSAAYTQPIVSVGIDASHFSFQLYGGGVYNEPRCKKGIDDLDHGVAVVGYGSKGGKDYYIVRNSWGAGWGLDGYIWMSRNKDNQCGIATQACFAEL